MSADLFAGIDVGGTNQTVALAGAGGAVLARRRLRSAPGATAHQLVDGVTAALAAAIEEGRAAAPESSLRRIGVGFGGPVHFGEGRILTSHHVSEWAGYPLRERLQARFGVPVVVDNDANAAALGEARYGAGRGRADLLYLNIGTGIGAGLVLAGRLYRGHQSLAGEIGHVTVEPGGAACACGKRGCLEAYASGRSLGRRAREAAGQQPDAAGALLRLSGGTVEAIDGPHVVAAAAGGDALAGQLMTETAEYLALALGNATNLLNPAAIVLGGGVSAAGDVLLAPLRDALSRYLMPGMPAPDLLPAALGYDAGVLGAVALAVDPS